MIKIENVCMYYTVPKRYKEYLKHPFKSQKFLALNEVNLHIKTGDKIAFLGINGAGKTTLMKLIGGLLYPTSGNISLNSFDTIKENMKARANVGFVLNEERSFYWRLTGNENLRFFGALDDLYGDTLECKINELMILVGLKKVGNKLFASYSSGMKQRLAIARGLLSEPDILILDEPTRTLDPVSSEHIKEIISKKVHENKERTLLIVTHKLDEAQSLCNKICIMKNGEIINYSDINNILSEYQTLENCFKVLTGDEFKNN